jgi:hypothetical protein
LRYRNPAGKWCRARASTEQIAVRLRRGRLSAKIEARHANTADYHPLSFYPEFKDIVPSRLPRKQPAKVKPAPIISPAPQLSAEPWYGRRPVLVVGAGSAVLLCLAVLYLILHG